MEWAIIVFVTLSLVGSVMWVMPTKRQKYQAALRLHAKKLGFQVNLGRVTAPRAKGEMDQETRNITHYRLFRHDLTPQQKKTFVNWQVFNVDAMANTGLPKGWCWEKGEKNLSDEALNALSEFINKLPSGVFAIESSSVYLSLLWDEEGGEEQLETLKNQMTEFMKYHI